jgi:hypothetical protein
VFAVDVTLGSRLPIAVWLGWHGLNFHAAKIGDQPVGRFRVDTVICESERLDDGNKLTVLGALTFEQHMVELVACDREAKVDALVGRAASQPRVVPDLARTKSGLLQRVHDIGDSVTHHYLTPPRSFVQEKASALADRIERRQGLLEDYC